MEAAVDEKKMKALAAELAKHVKTEKDLGNLSAMLTKLTVETALNAELGPCKKFCVWTVFNHAAITKRSPNWIASCALAACHSFGGRFHFFVMFLSAR